MKARDAICRTIKMTQVEVKDSITGKVIESYPVNKKTTKEKELVKYVTKTGNGGVFVEVTVIDEQRGISLENFMKYSLPIKDGELVEPVTATQTSTEKVGN